MSDDANERKRYSSGQMRAVRVPTKAIAAEYAALTEWAIRLLKSAGKSDEEARLLVAASGGELRMILGTTAIAAYEEVKVSLGLERLT